MNYTWETLDKGGYAFDPGVTVTLSLVAPIDLHPPVLIATGECDGIDVVSLQFSRLEFCPEPTMLSAWLEGRAVGHRIVDGKTVFCVMPAGTYLVVQMRNTSTGRRVVELELRPPEKVAQLGDGMEGIEIVAGEVCPKCGQPGRRSTTIPSAFPADVAGAIMVHKYTRVWRHEQFEVSSHGGCPLDPA